MRGQAMAAAVVLLALAAAGAAEAQDLERDGERIFQQCFACHSMDRREAGLPGPNLAGVVRRRAAQEPGFGYSPAMRQAGAQGLVWTADSLERFVADPGTVVPGTSMKYLGLKKAEDRAALLEYLKSRP